MSNDCLKFVCVDSKITPQVDGVTFDCNPTPQHEFRLTDPLGRLSVPDVVKLAAFTSTLSQVALGLITFFSIPHFEEMGTLLVLIAITALLFSMFYACCYGACIQREYSVNLSQHGILISRKLFGRKFNEIRVPMDDVKKADVNVCLCNIICACEDPYCSCSRICGCGDLYCFSPCKLSLTTSKWTMHFGFSVEHKDVVNGILEDYQRIIQAKQMQISPSCDASNASNFEQLKQLQNSVKGATT